MSTFFGEGYMPSEGPKKVAEGKHNAKIVNVEGKTNQYGLSVWVTVSIDGETYVTPNLFILSNRPESALGSMTLEQSQALWDRNMTNFFDNFGISRGNFKISEWVGHSGIIEVRQQKKKPEYNEIYVFGAPEKKNKPAQATASQNPVTTNEPAGPTLPEGYIF